MSVLQIEKSEYEKNLLIAQKLNIQEPILQQKLNDRSLFMINQPKDLYYKGVRVIESEVNFLNKLIAEAKEFEFNFNPILDQASTPTNISDSPLKFGILGFVAGLFLTLVYLIIRDILLKKNNIFLNT